MQLKYAFETSLDSPIDPGLGASFFLEGWAFCPEQRIAALEIDLAGRSFPVIEFGNVRRDVHAWHSEDSPRQAAPLFSGFWVPLPILPAPAAQTLSLRLVARLRDGQVLRSPVHHLQVLPGPAPAGFPEITAPLPERPLIHIAMTTYNPTEEVFRRQIDSLRAQDYTHWLCLIQDDRSSSASMEAIRRVLADDPRFILQRNERNLGFYFNFEKVLRRIPATAHLVCLCDQDDYWQPRKLSSLLAGFTTRDTTLVYSDMRIVAADGKVLSDTFWSFRKNNYTDLETLFFANTITGAAMMFKAALLPRVLPFPLKLGHIYHDWWMALVALASGRLNFIQEPLYDYYQHESNVIGWTHMGKAASALAFLRSNAHRRQHAAVATSVYETDGKFMANTILALRLRVPNSPRQPAIDRLTGVIQYPVRTLADQYLRALWQRRASQPREKHYLMAYTLVRMLNSYRRLRYRKLFANPNAAPCEVVDSLAAKCAPIKLDVMADEPVRVNIFLSTIDFKYVFAGYIAMLQLARRLAKTGFKVRLILLDRADLQPEIWRVHIRQYAGLEDLFDRVELASLADRSRRLVVSPRDRFIATSCWSAWVADAAARQLAAGPFLFMIQEFEPYLSPHGSYYALSQAAYELDHFGVFSTEILREFFRINRLGVYRAGAQTGDARSISFHNAIASVDVSVARLKRREGGKRRLLFYCRPEPHAQRNLFEMGILALRKAIAAGALSPEHWDYYGIGTLGEQFAIPLDGGAQMIAMPKMSFKEYVAWLPDFDLGMSLMLSPHPSLVPIEMAAAGLITVTNTFANKTAGKLTAISPNFEIGEATIDSLAQALGRAAPRTADLDARIAGAKINWPTSWDQALAPDTLAPLLSELGKTCGAPSPAV